MTGQPLADRPRPALPGTAFLTALLLAWLAFFAQGAAAALTVSPTSLSIPVGGTGRITVTEASGTVRIEVSDRNLMSATYANGRVTVTGLRTGRGSLSIRDNRRERTVSVTIVRATTPAGIVLTPNTLSIMIGRQGSVAVSGMSGVPNLAVSDLAVVSAGYANGRLIVSGLKAGQATVTLSDTRSSATLAVVVTDPNAATGSFALLAWNDLGMHCVDGKDYSIFSILPPYNNLHAQLIDAATGKVVTTGVTLTYEAIADPQGSINTSSSTKTNFWQYVKSLFGADVPPDVGLTGNPMATSTPAPLTYNATHGWFEAEGIPIMPYDDHGAKNYYPLVNVVARDGSGRLLASAKTVLPVSDEMTCKGCHASVASGNPAQVAAKPDAGWVADPDAEKDWKRNILRLHDQKQRNLPAFTSAIAQLGYDTRGLEMTAQLGRPILCAACHGSNALPGTGLPGISAMTAAIHARHADVRDPVEQIRLDDIGNRSACYTCHPGSATKCLRGAMGSAVDANGNASMGCQSCHGGMTAVGNPARVGWLEQPNCQACHHDGVRDLTALDTAGLLKHPADTRFATNPNTPALGFSLYRFSKGHGNLQCEACHGATHAVYPSSHENDNLQAIALQGHAGTVAECTTCHVNVPSTASGGPHGMHSTTSWWVGAHGDIAERSTQTCATCHGADYRGSPLSKVTAPRSFSVEGRTKTYSAGQSVTCYDCHNGPRGD